MTILKITQSSHKQDCLEFHNPSPDLRDVVVAAVMNNRMDSDAYKAKEQSCPFLQCDCSDYLLVEFWGRKPQEFVDYLQILVDELEAY